MSDPKEKRFRKDIRSLPDIFRFVGDRLASLGIDGSQRFWADLVVEELFTNMVKYSPEGRRDVAIRLDSDHDRLLVQLTDFDVEAFDVTMAPVPDPAQSLADLKPGGLGLHLVRQIADSIAYEYKDRSSIVTVTKRLEC